MSLTRGLALRSGRFALLLAGARVAGAHGQTVQGYVRDSASREPIPGAVVTIADSAGRPLARVISNGDGHYHLPTLNGRELQLLRIGFRRRTVALSGEQTAHDTTLDLMMVAIPHLLDRVVVSDNPLCRGGEEQSRAMALWDQARAALLANVIARHDSVQSENVRYERSRDIKSDAIVQQITQRATLRHISPFITSHTAAEFAARGYMSEDSTGSTFSAPDADVLLDPSFAATHCFGVRTEKNRPTQIGLTIRPVKDNDRLVDITGTLWMDTDRPALRSLDFAYTALARAAQDAHPGGQISFREMRPGVVFVDRWNIRMAELRLENPDQSSIPTQWRTDRAIPRLVKIHESGGEVVSARWNDGITWNNTLGRVSGRVVDAESGKPVPALSVYLASSFDSTKTDSSGDFTFRDLVPGIYTVVASDDRFAVFGLARQQRHSTQVARESTSSVSIQWPSIETRLRRVCRDEPWIPRGDSTRYGTLLGRVILPDGSLAIGARVDPVLLPDGSTADSAKGRDIQMSEDAQHLEQGVFVLCNVERGKAVLIHATHPNTDTATVEVSIPQNQSLREIVIHLTPRRTPDAREPSPVSSAKKSSPASPPDQRTHPPRAP